jgi:hypothetical protein
LDRKGAGLAGLLLAGTMVFGMTACGGGSDKDESSSKAESSATAPAASDDSSSSSDDADTPSAGDFLDSDCQDAVAAYSTIFTSAMGGSSMLSDEEKQQLEDNIDDLEGKVPSELEDDIAVIADAYQAYFEALGDLDLSDMVNNQGNVKDIEEAGEKIESDEVKDAQANIEAFFDENCPSMSGAFGS